MFHNFSLFTSFFFSAFSTPSYFGNLRISVKRMCRGRRSGGITVVGEWRGKKKREKSR